MMSQSRGTRKVSLAGLKLLVLGLFFHTFGLATPEWSVLRRNSSQLEVEGVTHYGLFRFCTKISNIRTCHDYSVKKPAIETCGVFALGGMSLGMAGLVLSVVNLIRGVTGQDQSHVISLTGGLCCLFAFGATLTTAVLFAAVVHDSQTAHLGYSFASSTASCMLFVIAGILQIMDARANLHTVTQPEAEIEYGFFHYVMNREALSINQHEK